MCDEKGLNGHSCVALGAMTALLLVQQQALPLPNSPSLVYTLSLSENLKSSERVLASTSWLMLLKKPSSSNFRLGAPKSGRNSGFSRPNFFKNPN